ncbi:MAG: hypothetical protein KIT72_04900 [Polyangiaceae bacterium]|nr:hypothetical protein [Polyangiaceae bacterium]MCW5789742.1 hypothetical protein [Polyangiaceae bacterium]
MTQTAHHDPSSEASAWRHAPSTRQLSTPPRVVASAAMKRAGAGLGLATLFGLAIGMRAGGADLLHHAVGVPVGLSAVVLLGAPSVFVFLSICRAELDAPKLAELVSRAVESAGLSLAGLAPAALLFVLTSDADSAAAYAAGTGLSIAGGVALVRLVGGLIQQASKGSAGSIAGALFVSAGFSVFACLLAARAWSRLLPIFGGAS